MKRILAYLVTISLAGCFGLFDSSADRITGRYNIGWIDVVASRSINMADKEGAYGGSQIVPAYVFAVGHNNRFIVAKRHPLLREHSEKVDTTETNYYIVDLSKENYFGQKGVFGPLTKAKYDSFCENLGVGCIEFNLKYPEIP